MVKFRKELSVLAIVLIVWAFFSVCWNQRITENAIIAMLAATAALGLRSIYENQALRQVRIESSQSMVHEAVYEPIRREKTVAQPSVANPDSQERVIEGLRKKMKKA